MSEQEIVDMFQKHKSEYRRFDRIPEGDRLHVREDVCALMYLHEKFGGSGQTISFIEDDMVVLDWLLEDLHEATERDVVYLLRCGINVEVEEGLIYFIR